MNLEILRTAPAKLKAIHHVGRAKSTWSTLLIPIMLYMLGKELRRRSLTHNIISSNPSEVTALLTKYGLEPSSLPTSLGGEFTSTRYMQWLERNV